MSNTHQVFEPLTVLTAQAALLRGANMDTDQIIPARFLKKDRAQGYGQYLLGTV
jgi:3-isopropylmalate/(R)-2-methylmalate dehydratase small subunit